MEGSNARIETHLGLSEVAQEGTHASSYVFSKFHREVIMKDEQASEG